MLKIERILYPTDFSPCAAKAGSHALRLAERHDAELHLLHTLVLHEVEPDSAAYPLPGFEGLYESLEEQADTQLRRAAEPIREAGVPARCERLRGISPASAILQYADEQAIDLIVLGTHGRRGLRRLLLGSVAEEVIRLAPCPVLTVPERSDSNREAGVANHILVPVDFSKYSRLALEYARRLAELNQARAHLLHVVEEVVYPDFYPPATPAGGGMTGELRQESLERLREAARELEDAGIAVETHVRAGPPASEISDFAAEAEADLIVIASHGLTGLRHMLLGSVTEQIVRRSTCPVFTVKTFGKNLVKG